MIESELGRRVLAGENRGLMRLAAEGVLPVPQEELVALQVRLAAGEDPDVAATAANSLASVEPRVILGILAGDADGEVLSWFARHSSASAVLEAIIQRRDVDLSIIHDLAQRGQPSVQEVLLLRQDRIRENPEILESLERNPSLSTYSKRRIEEYRMHLLEREKEPEPEPEPAEDEELSFEDDVELQEAIEEILEEVPAEGEIDERTGLSEGQVRGLPTPMRAKLARGASRTLRGILLRDQNPQVAMAVLTGSAVSESEIEQVSSNRYIVEEVLTAVANRREWVSKYGIMHNLVRNPRTPVGIAVRLAPRLSVRDLNLLKTDRNVADAVRQTAKRLHMVKSK